MSADPDISLALFLRDAPERIARIAEPALRDVVATTFRPEAASVARQASGGWSVTTRADPGFSLSSALREFVIGAPFGVQCAQVCDMVAGSRNPELAAALSRLPDPPAAILSAFFHYFVIHELLHVEQGLGSDQYLDSELYMPIVMEADHVADVGGLAIAVSAGIPELAPLDDRERVLLFIAVHIAAMHSFGSPGSLDASAFSRLLVWYVHFARFSKARSCPDLSSTTMVRPWIITLPRLVGSADVTITLQQLGGRANSPYPASCDIVLAYHQEDGLYRIHRAAMTDAARTHRLCEAIVNGAFDAVRSELEELLITNPALVPNDQTGRTPGVEWAAGAVIEALERVRQKIAADAGRDAQSAADQALADYARLVAAVRSSASPTPAVTALIGDGREALDHLYESLAEPDVSSQAVGTLRRRALSIVDQIVLAHSAAQSE